MKLGDSFASFDDLERAIKLFEAETFTNLTKSRSRTIKGAKVKGLRRDIDPQLEYVELDYKCIKAGKFLSKSKGIRPGQTSFREECPVYVKVRVNSPGTKLIVKGLETEHNHVTSQAIYNRLIEAKAISTKLLAIRVKKRMLEKDLRKSYGNNKVVQQPLKDFQLSTLNMMGSMSYPERFRIAKCETNRIASIMAKTMNNGVVDRFEARRNELLELIRKWTLEDEEEGFSVVPKRDEEELMKLEEVIKFEVTESDYE